MIRLVHRLLLTAAGLCSGCGNLPATTAAPAARSHVIVVPGVFGDGQWYDGLRRAAAAPGTAVSTFAWGLPKPLFVGNFSSASIHQKAENELAAAIDRCVGDLDLIGHSAGCGVILGALGKTHRHVGRVVLIAPSVSPDYDLSAALMNADYIHAFYSGLDTLFLKWRCGTFGTYDGVKTPAAGYAGFTANDPRLTQHPYDPAWRRLGNDGGHSGGTAAAFAKQVITPLLSRSATNSNPD